MSPEGYIKIKVLQSPWSMGKTVIIFMVCFIKNLLLASLMLLCNAMDVA